jgi:hypothetical protein
MTGQPGSEEFGVRDRREHGGAPMRHDDDALARRAERERVDAGVDDYDPDDVPAATDDGVPYDPTDDDTSNEARAEVSREAEEGELHPIDEEHPFPPTRYDRA